MADYAYGKDHERQKFDFWQAKSDKPTPVVLLIHGGGWMNGDKTGYGTNDIQPFLNEGISVAAINYRFIAAGDGARVEPPVKACLHDAARALQTIRSKAKEWNIDRQARRLDRRLGRRLHVALAGPARRPGRSQEQRSGRSRVVAARLRRRQRRADVARSQRAARVDSQRRSTAGMRSASPRKGRGRAEEFDLLIANRDKVMPWIKEYSPIELVIVRRSADLSRLSQSKNAARRRSEGSRPDALGHVRRQAGRKAASRPASKWSLSYPGHEDQKYGSIVKFLIAKLKQ